MLMQNAQVFLGVVTLVGLEAVNGIDGVPGVNHRVAMDLGDDGGRGDGCGDGVAVNDGPLLNVEVEFERVDEEEVWSHRKLAYCFDHGHAGGVIDVDLIDACRVDGCDRPGNAMLLDA